MVVLGIDIGKDVFFAHLRAAEGCPPFTPCALPNVENTVAGCAQLLPLGGLTRARISLSFRS